MIIFVTPGVPALQQGADLKMFWPLVVLERPSGKGGRQAGGTRMS